MTKCDMGSQCFVPHGSIGSGFWLLYMYVTALYLRPSHGRYMLVAGTFAE